MLNRGIVGLRPDRVHLAQQLLPEKAEPLAHGFLFRRRKQLLEGLEVRPRPDDLLPQIPLVGQDRDFAGDPILVQFPVRRQLGDGREQPLAFPLEPPGRLLFDRVELPTDGGQAAPKIFGQPRSFHLAHLDDLVEGGRGGGLERLDFEQLVEPGEPFDEDPVIPRQQREIDLARHAEAIGHPAPCVEHRLDTLLVHFQARPGARAVLGAERHVDGSPAQAIADQCPETLFCGPQARWEPQIHFEVAPVDRADLEARLQWSGRQRSGPESRHASYHREPSV